eukprot:m51a1_g8805 putative trna isopentenyltransferase (369) ;mRNA; r:277548-279632
MGEELRVCSCSSYLDAAHGAERAIDGALGTEWLCDPAQTRSPDSAWLELTFAAGAARVASIDITNAGSMLVEVLVADPAPGRPLAWQVILPVQLMQSMPEARAGTNRNRSRRFGPEKLTRATAAAAWPRLRVVCRNPCAPDKATPARAVAAARPAPAETATPATPAEGRQREEAGQAAEGAQERKAGATPARGAERTVERENTVMEGVVVAVSGIGNPLRGEIRDKTLRMGGAYTNDIAEATHLVSEYTTTPKYAEMKRRNGHIVNKNWAEGGHGARLGKLVVVIGATGVGKTKLAVDVAAAVGGEVVGADAMQLYAGLDVVTNKASPEERAAVPHHMLGLIDPLAEPWNVHRHAMRSRNGKIPASSP